MNTPLPALQWKQNGVNHIVKLLPGGRIGALSDEILAEIRESNGKLDAKIMAIRSGNVQLVRQLQNEHIEGKELATTELEEWEESMAGPSGTFDVTYCQPKTPPAQGRPAFCTCMAAAGSTAAARLCCLSAAIWPSRPTLLWRYRNTIWPPNTAGLLRWKIAGSCSAACMPRPKQGALTPQESLWQGTAPAATWPLCAPTATVTAALAWSTARCCITPR